MPLIICPDCNKQISNRAKSCPFCGCPSEYFPEAINHEENSPVQNESTSEPIQNEAILVSEQNDVASAPVKEDTIDFHFGNNIISYPVSYKKYANLYGKYSKRSDILTKRYLMRYDDAGNLYKVLTSVADSAKKDINKVIDDVLTDLYSNGVIMSFDEFKGKYVRDFDEMAYPLYKQFDEIINMKNNLDYEREATKASRGRWVGGGFGLKGAIKGAINAEVLNAGAGLFHSIGDGMKESGDNKKIKRLMDEAYNKNNNRLDFIKCVNCCCNDAVKGLTMEFSRNGLIDNSCIEDLSTINTLYESTKKYEKDHDKYVSNIIRCIKSYPSNNALYWKIMPDLFEQNCELKEFLDFWNLNYLYADLLKQYTEDTLKNYKNSFLLNMSNFVIVVNHISNNSDNTINITGKLLKGNLNQGDTITLIKDLVTPILSTKIIDLKEIDGSIVDRICLGKEYRIIVEGGLSKTYNASIFIVDSRIYNSANIDDYAIYVSKHNNNMVWSFKDESKGCDEYDYSFISNNKYMSARGISFSSSYVDIKKAYIRAKLYRFDRDIDIIFKRGKEKSKNNNSILAASAKYLEFKYNTDSTIRFYFDSDDQLILVAYLKNLEEKVERELYVKQVYVKPEKTLSSEEAINQYVENLESEKKDIIPLDVPKTEEIKKTEQKNSEIKNNEPKAEEKTEEIKTDETNKEHKPAISEPSPKMFCPFCGKEILRKSNFCCFCGKQNTYGGLKK